MSRGPLDVVVEFPGDLPGGLLELTDEEFAAAKARPLG
jgi:hypothetical protein